MKRDLKLALVLSGLILCLIMILSLRSEPIMNRLLARSLRNEDDPNGRVVLINTSRGLDPKFWNPIYLQFAALAGSQQERVVIADLLRERLSSNVVMELEKLIEEEKVGTSRSNALAVLRLIGGSSSDQHDIRE